MGVICGYVYMTPDALREVGKHTLNNPDALREVGEHTLKQDH